MRLRPTGLRLRFRMFFLVNLSACQAAFFQFLALSSFRRFSVEVEGTHDRKRSSDLLKFAVPKITPKSCVATIRYRGHGWPITTQKSKLGTSRAPSAIKRNSTSSKVGLLRCRNCTGNPERCRRKIFIVFLPSLHKQIIAAATRVDLLQHFGGETAPVLPSLFHSQDTLT
jgi:hypothetical protein